MPKIDIPDIEQFDMIVRRAVAEVVDAKLPDAIRKANQKAWLTTAEVRELTGFSYRKLSYLRAENLVSFRQHGRAIQYECESLEKFLAEHIVSAVR